MVDHVGALATAPRRGPAVRCRGIAAWKGRASHSPRRSFGRLLQSRPRTLQAHAYGGAQTLGAPPVRLKGQGDNAARARIHIYGSRDRVDTPCDITPMKIAFSTPATPCFLTVELSGTALALSKPVVIRLLVWRAYRRK